MTIKGIDKEKIKKRFIINDKSRMSKRHNRKIIVAIYSYLLYKLLCEFPEANPLLVCRDVRPERLVMKFLIKIANLFNNRAILNREIKFRKRIEFGTEEKLPKSLAGKYVKKVYQKKIPVNKILNDGEIDELIRIVELLCQNKVRIGAN